MQRHRAPQCSCAGSGGQRWASRSGLHRGRCCATALLGVRDRLAAFRATACPICWSGCRLRSARCRLGSRGRHKGLCAITPLTPHPTTPLCDAHPPLICSRWRRRGGRDESGCERCRRHVSPDGRHLYHRPEEDTRMLRSSVAPEKCRGPAILRCPCSCACFCDVPGQKITAEWNSMGW